MPAVSVAVWVVPVGVGMAVAESVVAGGMETAVAMARVAVARARVAEVEGLAVGGWVSEARARAAEVRVKAEEEGASAAGHVVGAE